jgi:hypothetical protein
LRGRSQNKCEAPASSRWRLAGLGERTEAPSELTERVLPFVNTQRAVFRFDNVAKVLRVPRVCRPAGVTPVA